ncbi:MAG: hypothetical protein DI556_04880 [Rhodovulum sulfidophilum]|uniref:Acyltransferase 3 domain-containing protein n=1 Tax=Rhodovulum sulfidophilum TaxID=35806 RepID=A0A2W5ND83_RHOSU|nr:MAG: hypothetical protein DI556_04880 [Rhodovulum sulfidophilum]
MSGAALTRVLPPPATTRRAAVEAARLPAALGVVWFHMQAPGWRIACGALGLFIILAVVFAAGAVARQGRAAFLRGRLARLAPPWLFWSGFYLATTAALLRDPLAALTPASPRAFLIGGALHLWFLPFLLLASGLVALVAPALRARRGFAALFMVALPLAVGCFWAQAALSPPAPFAQWAFGLPCVLYALLAARDGEGAPARLGFLALVAAGAFALGAREDIGPFLITALGFELVWRLGPRGGWLAAGSGCAFGVYLLHPFFILVYHKLLAGDGRSPEAVLLVFAASFLATAALRRVPSMRRFL